jgi:hypothetical protein
MRFDYSVSARQGVLLLALALLAQAAPLCAQGLGLGARIAWVHPDVEADVDAVRYFGGQLRLLGRRVGLEVALDHRSESLEVLNQKVTEIPLQTSLILRMASSRVSPFLLGGPGWYRRKVEALDSASGLSVSTTDFGWHAGIGLEVLASKHFGVHGDYRYTFLNFHDDGGGGLLGLGKVLPGHRGSMWTLGATVYF